MLPSASESSALVIDAGIGAATVLGGSLSGPTGQAWAGWRARRTPIYAPELWRFEATSAIRKALAFGEIEPQEAQAGLAAILALEVTLVPADDALCRSALHFAERLGQSAAYDGFYLALASRLQAEFWTTDQRLVNAARQAGIRWTHWVGELESNAA